MEEGEKKEKIKNVKADVLAKLSSFLTDAIKSLFAKATKDAPWYTKASYYIAAVALVIASYLVALHGSEWFDAAVTFIQNLL